ncbi:MAG: hypothetical protein RL603_847 [Pseudomonadota bacterium]
MNAISPTLAAGHWSSETAGEGHAVFNAEGIHCANCARSIRTGLEALPGLRRVDINVVDRRVSVVWDTARLNLASILAKVAALGFKPVPLVGERAVAAQRLERRTALKRTGLAGLGAMQLMMYAVGLYAGAFSGMDPALAEFLRWTCLVIATPVLFYSGAPILRGAYDDLRRRVLGMDVTVALALILAFVASVVNTIRNVGEVYFDSVAMFIFFLSLGRYVEMRGRHQSANVTEALARALPETVQRLDSTLTTPSRIPLGEVVVGDRLRIGSGQVVPVDGLVVQNVALLDESLVTGESAPVTRTVGAALLGGSVNAGAAFAMEVTRLPQDSTLHGLVRLLERAQGERPRLGLAAERMASWFVVRVLLLTAVVGIGWYFVDPSRAFPALLAVLVATCPCALSLATPVAIAAATSHLAKLGVLVLRADAVEGLATIDRVMLDKTGTLTAGTPKVLRCATRAGVEPARALALAAALEAGSTHPIAAAFRPHADPTLHCHDAREIAGAGIEGRIEDQRYRIGRASFALEGTDDASHRGTLEGVVIADARGWLADFRIADELRGEARATLDALRALGITPALASGDRHEAVDFVATQLAISEAAARLSPEDKLAMLKRSQQAGHRVLMIGDGINDGPVLAAADVSMAMGRGSPIAHAAGDLLLLRDSLAALPQSIEVARRALAIVRQNLRWAAAYNLAAIPLAALGLMPPWVAAIGMSLSSLVVVFNARRIAAPNGGH